MQKRIYSFALLSRRGIMAAMRLQPIIVPGWKNSGPEHWQSRWADALPHAIRVQQRDWEQPSCAEWTAAVAAEVTRPAVRCC